MAEEEKEHHENHEKEEHHEHKEKKEEHQEKEHENVHHEHHEKEHEKKEEHHEHHEKKEHEKGAPPTGEKKDLRDSRISILVFMLAGAAVALLSSLLKSGGISSWITGAIGIALLA
ncbi:MAG: hypothetical protein MUP55_02915, partial [Candidatus Aenigmarchaeota archaeon]|nr:hypothetical protein [Candidatus Aenigmarchaeota archaeon]